MPSEILCHAGEHYVDRTEIVSWASGDECCADCIDVGELVKDRERLDWLIENQLIDKCGGLLFPWIPETMRSQIDAAMKEKA